MPDGTRNVDLIVNELSLHGQFADLAAFRESIGRVMQVREVARRHRRALYCHRGFANRPAMSDTTLRRAVATLSVDQQRAVMAWLDRSGPYWDDEREHDGGDWYECGGEIITDTAIGEAAHCLLHGIDRGLVSLIPSDLAYDPVSVEQVIDELNRVPVAVPNFWDAIDVDAYLAAAQPALSSWATLEALAKARFTNLTFGTDAFQPLRAQPFGQGVAERILARLDVIDRLTKCFDEVGRRTDAGHALYQKHFVGDKAWFSDESASNKVQFRDEMTFPNPDVPGETIFCPWHGKVKTPQYRVHISWPIRAASPVYVVYVGPKITKR